MSPYTREATADQIAADCSEAIKGKTILITGTSPGGLGAEFAQVICKYAPGLLILANRDVAKASQTAQVISELAPSVPTRILKLDLASQTQIREAAREVLEDYPETNIHVLVNNAGVMAGPYRLTTDGVESQFGTNHIGHFLFTNLIMRKLVSTDDKFPAARVVNVSSNGYRLGWVRFGDWNFDNGKTYDQWAAYGQSKSANNLFAISLAERFGATKGLVAVSLCPGLVSSTNLSNALTMTEFKALAQADRAGGHSQCWVSDFSKYAKTKQQGVATHVFAAFHNSISPTVNNGFFLQDNGVVSREDVYPWGRDPIDAAKLWRLSEEIVGQKFDY